MRIRLGGRAFGGRSRRRSMWFWLLVVVVVVLLLGLFFGGYRKGTRVDGLGYAPTRVMNSQALATPPIRVASTGTTST